jgi:transitional endoplasmic reticulum ATPase
LNKHVKSPPPNIARILAEALSDTGQPPTDWSKIDTPLDYEGKRIVLPADPGKMDIDTGIETLERIREQENQEFDVREVVKAAPWDALVAIYMAMQDIYGVVMAQSIQTFFGEIKPDYITVDTGFGPTDKIQVPMGQMSLPGVTEPVNIALTREGAQITGTVRKRDRAILIEIANRARERIKTASVYRGKAIRIGVDDNGILDLGHQPEFLNLTNVKVTDMIHTKETEALIKTNILAILEHTAECRKNRIPLKRGVLLSGKYGTGKSLTARVAAKVANDNGWTFIVLDRSQGLRAAIEFARAYQPCVIFAEDIDRSADRDNEDVNDLVNLIDGVINKDMEIMTVLTTNFIEKIDKALLRPGRFDAVIEIQSPDPATAERLIRSYARELLAPEIDLTQVGVLLDGQIPATIREVVERAKLSMLVEDRDHLTAGDLYASAVGMKRHMELLDPKVVNETPAEVFYNAFKGLLEEAKSDVEGDEDWATVESVDDAKNAVIEHVTQGRIELGDVSRNVKAGAQSAKIAADILQKGGGAKTGTF